MEHLNNAMILIKKFTSYDDNDWLDDEPDTTETAVESETEESPDPADTDVGGRVEENPEAPVFNAEDFLDYFKFLSYRGALYFKGGGYDTEAAVRAAVVFLYPAVPCKTSMTFKFLMVILFQFSTQQSLNILICRVKFLRD